MECQHKNDTEITETLGPSQVSHVSDALYDTEYVQLGYVNTFFYIVYLR